MRGEGTGKRFSGEGADEPYRLFKIGMQGTDREEGNGWEEGEKEHRLITPFLHHANIPHSEVSHHEMETSRQGTALILRLQPRYTHQGGNDTTTAVKEARVGECAIR